METQGITDMLNDYNCRHWKFPVIVGVTPPMYSDEDLARFAELEQAKHLWNGREYTLYELTQLQNRYNRQMNINLNKATAWNAAGNHLKFSRASDRFMASLQKRSEVADKITAAGINILGDFADIFMKAVFSNVNTNIVFRSVFGIDLARMIATEYNYRNNMNIDVDWEFIRSQNSEPYSKYRMGLAVTNNACGWVAAFNALLELDKFVNPAHIISFIENNNGLIADGVFGTNPAIYDSLFKSHGFSSTTTFINSNLDAQTQAGQTAILAYFHEGAPFGGAHYITITWNAETGMYTAWNVYGNSTNSRPYSSIDDILSEENRTFISLTVVK
jgi:hypothetical protein